MRRIVIGVDPSGGTGETGIVAAGLGVDDHGYVLADETLKGSPNAWSRQVVSLYDRLKADRVVVEKNFGGDMVESTLRTVRRDLPITMVTASRGKAIRAEPVAALYEQRRWHHIGMFTNLEDEMVLWDPVESDWSPNRIDALVWAVTDLAEPYTPATLIWMEF